MSNETSTDIAATDDRAELERLARAGFAAYNDKAGGLTWDKKPIPPWAQCGEKVQANWMAAAEAIREQVAANWPVAHMDKQGGPVGDVDNECG